MQKFHALFATAATLAMAAPAASQTPISGTADTSRIAAGNYEVDTHHTQVAWVVNHLGFNLYNGLFGSPTGTLTLDPTKPGTAAVSIDIPIENIVTTSTPLNAHLKDPIF